MASCQKIRRKKITHCAASFNKTISILTREQLASVTGSIDSTIDLPAFATVRAKLETTRPVEIFAGTNVKQIETHLFTIRFALAVATINKNHTIDFNSKFFRIDRIENVDEENRFFNLFCSIRGDITKDANRA